VPNPVIIFEDERFKNLYPLALTRPVFGLRCGILTLARKSEMALGAVAGYHMRDYLAPVAGGAVKSYSDLLGEGDPALLLNGRVVMTPALAGAFEPGWRGAYVSGGTVVAAAVGREHAGALDEAVGSALAGSLFDGLPVREVEAAFIDYPWDLVNLNGPEIESDHRLLGFKGIHAEVPDGVWLVNEADIYVGEGASLSPGVVLDASEGPVHIGNGASVMANACLKGPVHIGEGSTIKMGAKIYGETSIGPVSKIGGEVAETIVHGYANKQHEGFVGHSYLGEWVNLGAGTETSDLKNNYSTVRVRLDDKAVDSGEMFVGLYMGDHSKCGIGTTFNTGTVVGACCNIFGAGYPPKFIASFSWGGSQGFEEYDLSSAIETAGRAMRRRGVEPGPEVEAVLKKVYEITGDSREAFIESA
jgi:UDP-N-acetylglucosamine diphosphorylase/glucosamine-1-phosphate N-acetyltransferase